jgi:hypothetical protein
VDDGVFALEEVDADAASPPVAVSVDVDPPELASLPSSDGFLLPTAAARRSFFAHPEPLNTIVGAAIAFRTGPSPHSGQPSGGGSFTPWMISNRRPHAAQS